MPTVDENRTTWTSYDWTSQGDEWSRPWGSSAAGWYGLLLPRLYRWLPARTMVEIAPGYGRWTYFLKDHAERLIAVDLVANCVAACRDRFAKWPHVSAFVNDGRSLPMVADGTADFVFSFDSLVHADADAMQSYLSELGRVLTPDGVAFLHHSNVGSFPYPLVRLGRRLARFHPIFQRWSPVRHWRSTNVSAALVAQWAASAGVPCRTQELVDWGGVPYLTDCFTVLTRPQSRWARPNIVVKNRRLMQATHAIGARERLYG